MGSDLYSSSEPPPPFPPEHVSDPFYSPFPSAEFVNASFSFMLNPKGDYTAYFADSDIFFHWPDILQILVPGGGDVSADSSQGTGSELPNCPICLSVRLAWVIDSCSLCFAMVLICWFAAQDPVAPRMTKCGHVRCLPLTSWCTLAFSPSLTCSSLLSRSTATLASFNTLRSATARAHVVPSGEPLRS